jgi:bacteriocin biosynthesis cyclodehydratase domain-containing protein
LRPDADAPAPPQRLVPDLVVLADALAPDPAQVARLHAAGTAHLPARLRDGVGIVGPLVLPGRTACLGCLELHRSARDPAWPTVAAQLVGRRGRADPTAAAATAALTTEQALAALDATVSGSERPPTLETTIELDVTAATITRRTWTPQPGCRCGARGRAAPAVGFATGARRARSTDQGGESQGE